MLSYFWIAIGGALGSVARFWFATLVDHRFGEAFPLGTLLVNVSGSFAIGFFATLTLPEGPFPASPTFRQFFMIGICGGFTTFSAFSLQTLNLAHAGEWLYAAMNIVGSVVLCLAAVWLGHLAASLLNRA